MPLDCPKCGSRDLRYSRRRTAGERVRSWIGVRPLRCRDCRHRFVERTWRLSSLKYARCPNCWRMDLNSWSTESYRPTWMDSLLLGLGGRPYRCEYCRINFVSFRAWRERFTFKRWKKRRQASEEARAT